MTKEEINKKLKQLLQISDQEYYKLVDAYEKEIIKLSGDALRKIKIEIEKYLKSTATMFNILI